MVFLPMKRGREGKFDNITTMANCLMLHSRGGGCVEFEAPRVFKCKTCNRQFPSFQALGGHRASHKKPRLVEGEVNDQNTLCQSFPAKPKTHKCSICGLEFAVGQALGGHMRRHREPTNENQYLLDLFPMKVPVVKKTNNSRRVSLDLNLSPLENGLVLNF